MTDNILPLVNSSFLVNNSHCAADLTVQVKPGQSFTISLSENGGSTGYVWTPVVDGQGIVSSGGKDVEASALPIPGAAGSAHFQFDALKPGTTTIVFELRQPWQSKDAPAQRYSVEVTVSDS